MNKPLKVCLDVGFPAFTSHHIATAAFKSHRSSLATFFQGDIIVKWKFGWNLEPSANRSMLALHLSRHWVLTNSREEILLNATAQIDRDVNEPLIMQSSHDDILPVIWSTLLDHSWRLKKAVVTRTTRRQSRSECNQVLRLDQTLFNPFLMSTWLSQLINYNQVW